MLSKCWFTKGASTNIHNLSAGCNSGEYRGRNSQKIPVGTWTFALRCHPAISWTNRIIFSAVASSNAAKVFNTTFNHCVFTLGIKYQWVFPVFSSTKPYTYNHWYLGSTTALCLSPTGDHSFFYIGFNPILCSSKNQTYIWAWGYFSFSYFTFNGSFFLTLFELVPTLFYVYISVSARSNRTFLGNPIPSDYSLFVFGFLFLSISLLLILSKSLHRQVFAAVLLLIFAIVPDLIRVVFPADALDFFAGGFWFLPL